MANTRFCDWIKTGLVSTCFFAAQPSHAYVVTINPGTKSLFLQVGTGTITGGTFLAGGTPGNNTTVNTASVTVPVASVGAGTVAMTTNSTVTASPLDGFVFCSVPREIYIGGYYRNTNAGNPATASLTVTAPSTLTNAALNTIPFNTISWISGGIGDAVATIPSGVFVGGAEQSLLTVARNTWFESCLSFNYSNAQIVSSGTFTGRVTYTLTAP
jgi:hypothetical protein